MIELAPVIVTLSNGIRLVYMHATSVVAHLGVTVLAGSRYEQSHEEGLAHFLEHCIFKGTLAQTTAKHTGANMMTFVNNNHTEFGK